MPSPVRRSLYQSKQNTPVACRPRQHFLIVNTGCFGPDPDDIVSGPKKSPHEGARYVLIGKKAHIRPRWGKPSPHSTYREHRQDMR